MQRREGSRTSGRFSQSCQVPAEVSEQSLSGGKEAAPGPDGLVDLQPKRLDDASFRVPGSYGRPGASAESAESGRSRQTQKPRNEKKQRQSVKP